MPYCSICGNKVNVRSLFCPKCGNRVGVVVNVQQEYSQSFQQQQQKSFKPNSNMAFAIFTTCLCCIPFGIYAIILASKVERLYDMGEYEMAEMTARDVKKWSIIGMVSGFLVQMTFLIIYILLIFYVED